MRSRPFRLLLLATALAIAVALTVLAAGSLGARAGYSDAARAVLLNDWWTLWAVPPVEILLIMLLAAGLVLRVRAAPDGERLVRRSSFAAAAVAVLVVGVCSPLAGLAQAGLLSAHMVQHVLVGAAAPLLVLLALPRAHPTAEPAPWGVRRLLHPASCLTLWVMSTVVWFLPPVHHLVLTDEIAWIGQQVSFFLFGVLLWAPITDRLRAAPEWFGSGAKCAYMVIVWFVGLLIANVFWFSGTAFYSSHAAAAQAWGISPLQDQANAGTVMVLAHCLMSFGAIGVLFFRAARESALRQRLLEAGLNPALVRQAIRFGGAEEMARTAGVPIHSRGGID